VLSCSCPSISTPFSPIVFPCAKVNEEPWTWPSILKVVVPVSLSQLTDIVCSAPSKIPASSVTVLDWFAINTCIFVPESLE